MTNEPKATHTPGHYVMEGTVNGKPFTREFVAIEDYNTLQGHYTALLALAKQYASECSGCNGTGLISRHIEGRDTQAAMDADDQPCEACADIRAVIEKAEGGV